MDSLFGPFARAVLAVLLVLGYAAFAFPAIANLDIDGAVLTAFLGAAAVLALAYSIVRPTKPTR